MRKGDVIRINYVGRLESGEIFDLTYEDVAKKEGIYSEKIRYKPVTIIVGAGFVISGLDKAIEKMELKEKKTVTVSPKEGFGERDPKLIRVIPQKTFRDQKLEPRQSMVVDFSGMKGRIQSVTGGRVRVDFNNPLAGKTLKYDIEVVEKIDDTEEKIKGVFEFFGIYNTWVRIENKEAFISVQVPHGLRQRLGKIIADNIEGIDKVTFQESYERSAKDHSKPAN